jgi:L,D-peptidoglycan transpeptidase YkuD (ErfK/YbiS/YcfS/YnhG family)
VRTDQVTKDWDSAETMLRPDGLYEWGVVEGHNLPPTQPGAGSCLFLHIWRGLGKPTSGCTSMSRQEMVRLARWLDPNEKPVLVQLPMEAYLTLAKPWGLP